MGGALVALGEAVYITMSLFCAECVVWTTTNSCWCCWIPLIQLPVFLSSFRSPMLLAPGCSYAAPGAGVGDDWAGSARAEVGAGSRVVVLGRLGSVVADSPVVVDAPGSGSGSVDVPVAAPVPVPRAPHVAVAAPEPESGSRCGGLVVLGSVGAGIRVVGAQEVAGAGGDVPVAAPVLELGLLLHPSAAPHVGLDLGAERSARSRCGGST